MFIHWLLFEEFTDKGVDFGENELAVERVAWNKREMKGIWLQCNLFILCSFLEITLSPLLADIWLPESVLFGK